MISLLSQILQQAGYDLSARELSEILWLAVHLDESLTPQQELSTKHKQNPFQKDQSEAKSNKAPKLLNQEPAADISVSSTVTSSNTIDTREGVSIKIAAASSLRDSLALSRALRPLMRKVPSPTENILDEEATVRCIAEADIWAPVLKPTPTRWLEVALVVEQTSTTAIWKQTITELQKLLKSHGAFRDVRTWKLEITANNVHLFPQNNIGSYSPTPYKPEVLIDPKSQRLILLISDCISPAWRNSLIHPVLELWGRKGLVTILQLLPERLWERTALASEIFVQLRSFNPAVFNSKFIINEELGMEDCEEDEIQNYIPIPIITLEPEPLRIWSQVMAGSGNIETVGFKFSVLDKLKEPTKTELGLTTAAPQVATVTGSLSAASVLGNITYQTLRKITGDTVGLYRTSWLQNRDNFGIGRHPEQGSHNVKDLSFWYEIIEEPSSPNPIQLTGSQYKQLTEALMDAFPNQERLAQFVRYQFDKKLDEITIGADLKEIVFKLIQAAQGEGWTDKLIAGALESNPSNSKLLAFAQEFNLAASMPPELLARNALE